MKIFFLGLQPSDALRAQIQQHGWKIQVLDRLPQEFEEEEVLLASASFLQEQVLPQRPASSALIGIGREPTENPFPLRECDDLWTSETWENSFFLNLFRTLELRKLQHKLMALKQQERIVPGGM